MKLQTGRTPRGDKSVNMPATMGGPFILTRKMGWDKFTEEVADIEQTASTLMIGWRDDDTMSIVVSPFFYDAPRTFCDFWKFPAFCEQMKGTLLHIITNFPINHGHRARNG